MFRLCLQVKTFHFILIGFRNICLSRQALVLVFESAFSSCFDSRMARIVRDEMAPYYLNKFAGAFVTHINPFSRARRIF